MGWELYEPEPEPAQAGSGFMGFWLATFIFVIVLFTELALMNG
jgi:hypothetical protein